MKVFYSNKMVAEIGRHTSPSSIKPKVMAKALEESGMQIELTEPEAVSVRDFCRAHDKSFVNGILDGSIRNGFGNRLESVRASLPYTSGAMVEAAKAALDDGLASALCSGFHHAYHGSAGGFCTFNGLMVTALYLQEHGLAKRIAIIDCDQHYGDGTDDIISRLDCSDIFHLSFGEHYHSKEDAKSYLDRFNKLRKELELFKPEVILYQAGADSHVDDPLGGVLTTEQMYERDLRMFSIAKELDIPLAWNLAGGYQRDSDGGISKVIDLHLNTFLAAEIIFQSRSISATDKA